MSDKKRNDAVVVAPQAAVSMILHAKHHSTTVIHGVLIGSRSGDITTVSNAIPLCHEPPTRTLVDTSLALVQAQQETSKNRIVGWFTAPEVLDDERPGPAALRIVANLETENFEPVLLVLNNSALAKFFSDPNDGSASELFNAFGKDFGKQWMEPLSLSLEKSGGVVEAAREACKEGLVVDDLVDHWEGSCSAEWDPSARLSELVEKHC